MLFDLVVLAGQDTVDHVVENTRTSPNSAAYHLVVPADVTPPAPTNVLVTQTDEPWQALQTRRLVCVEQPVRVSRNWETALLHGLNNGYAHARVVPALLPASMLEQRSLLEDAHPSIFTESEYKIEDRQITFNRTAELVRVYLEGAETPVWAADTAGPPPWDRPTLVVRSAVVDCR